MQTLDRRIAALEKTVDPSDLLTVVIRRFGGTGDDDSTWRVTTQQGQSWERRDGESGEDLEVRASAEVDRGPGGLATLIAHPRVC